MRESSLGRTTASARWVEHGACTGWGKAGVGGATCEGAGHVIGQEGPRPNGAG